MHQTSVPISPYCPHTSMPPRPQSSHILMFPLSQHPSKSLLLLLRRFSRVRLCATPWTAAHQAPPSPGVSRQEHWVDCHFLLQCMKVKSESEVAQSYPTLSDPMDCSLPGSSILGFSRQEYWSVVPLHSVPVTLITFPVLLRNLWLVAMVLDRTDTEHFYHCRKICCWTAPF